MTKVEGSEIKRLTNKRIRIRILTLIIPILTVLYGTIEYSGLSDWLLGRKSVLDSLLRLASPKGFPQIIIFDDEREFRPLLKLIISNTTNQRVKLLYTDGKAPSAIVRLGGLLSVPGIPDAVLQTSDFGPRFAPETSPVLFLYNYSRKGTVSGVTGVEPVCNLADVRNWVDNSRNRERFVLSTVLIGLLSIVVAILQWNRH